MALVNDLHHMTFLTADMDRLISFYERIFDARVTLDREDDGRRHAFIEIGPHTVLHPFEVPSVVVPGRQPIFERGRLDHFALHAASEEASRAPLSWQFRAPAWTPEQLKRRALGGSALGAVTWRDGQAEPHDARPGWGGVGTLWRDLAG